MDGFVSIFKVFFFFMSLFYYAIGLLLLIPVYLLGLIVSIFYYKMAKNAGCRNAWIAFLPFGKNYLAFVLPHREYNIGIIKTKRRKRLFWLSSIAEVIIGLAMGYGWAMMYAYFQCYNGYNVMQILSEMSGDTLLVCFFIILLLSGFVVFIIRSVIHGRKNYDLLKTYGYDQFAVWGSLLNVICPPVMVIMSILMAGRMPDYGMKNYYLK